MPVVFIPPYYAVRDYQLPLQGTAGFYYYDGYGNPYAVQTGIEHIEPPIPSVVDDATESITILMDRGGVVGNGTASFSPSWVNPTTLLHEFVTIDWSVSVDSSLARATLVPAWIPAESVLAVGVVEINWSVAIDSELAIAPQPIPSPVSSTASEPTKVTSWYSSYTENVSWGSPSPHMPYNSIETGHEIIQSEQYCDRVFGETNDNPRTHESITQHGLYEADQIVNNVHISEDDVGQITYDVPTDVTWFVPSALYPATTGVDFAFNDPPRTINANVDATTVVISYYDITLPFPPNPTVSTTNLTGTTETTVGAGTLT